jgi:SagB-type dehydrogenase family enzyme
MEDKSEGALSRMDKKAVRVVRDYHQRTKHRLNRYAASLGYLDWANQPDPFRTFAGSQQIELVHPALGNTLLYDDLFSQPGVAAALNADFIGRLFYHSLALSAWKQAPHTRPWSLRINPSSGALYPTEGYLVSGAVPGLIESPGVFHYAPFRHGLERRCRLSQEQWQRLTDGLPAACLFIGLTSIYWRESWKYGERAFRYCQLDVGHAMGAITFSARALGWEVRLVETMADDDLDRLLGTHLQTGIEAEHADCLLVVYPADTDGAGPPVGELAPEAWRTRVPHATFNGKPNPLSRDHHPWPVIAEVSQATRKRSLDECPLPSLSASSASSLPGLVPVRQHPAEQIFRQRRSAQEMDGRTWLERRVFYQILQRTLPHGFPFNGLPWRPCVALVIFVHRVTDLAPGLYLFARSAAHETSLRQSLKSDFQWQAAEGSPPDLRLYRLMADDVRRAAKMVSCHQDIAAEGVFSLGMLAEFDAALAGGEAWRYPRLYWECGRIGQVLYLEAEAAGMRGTGIGCFFDDVMHEILGIKDQTWQSLYHFTVGGSLEDARLRTIPPYAHLGKARFDET